jgi:hypothetical protein
VEFDDGEAFGAEGLAEGAEGIEAEEGESVLAAELAGEVGGEQFSAGEVEAVQDVGDGGGWGWHRRGRVRRSGCDGVSYGNRLGPGGQGGRVGERKWISNINTYLD